MWKVQGVPFLNYSKCIWDLNKVIILTTVMDWKRLLKARLVMEWKGCYMYFENRRLALGDVFCRVHLLGHRDYRGLCFAAWIDLLFNENEFLLSSRQQTTAVNYSFAHETKKASDCCQISILRNSQKKMFSNENPETAIFCKISLRIQWYFSQISVIKIELSTGKTDINLDKNSFNVDFFQFLQ